MDPLLSVFVDCVCGTVPVDGGKSQKLSCLRDPGMDRLTQALLPAWASTPASAASTIAFALASVVRCLPTTLATLLRARPVKGGEILRPFWPRSGLRRCRSLAAPRSSGSRALLIATASLGRKLRRWTFSACSPSRRRRGRWCALECHASRADEQRGDDVHLR